jgi:hypothetical protein
MMDPLSKVRLDKVRPFITVAQLSVKLAPVFIGFIALAKSVATLLAVLDDLCGGSKVS